MMQFVDLKTQYEKLKADIDEGIRKVLHHGKFIMGPDVAELEEKLADYVGVKHCISVSSGHASTISKPAFRIAFTSVDHPAVVL